VFCSTKQSQGFASSSKFQRKNRLLKVAMKAEMADYKVRGDTILERRS
jgi:hypothetical protein